MEPSSRFLERALEVVAGRPGTFVEADSKRTMAEDQCLVLAQEHRLLPTLAAARAAEGRDVTSELLGLVRINRARSARYRRIERFVTNELGVNATVLKGRLLADAYPDGWVRATTDLDLQVVDWSAVLAIGQAMESMGWGITKLLVFLDRGQPRAALDIMDTRQEPRSQDWVQVQGFAFHGDADSIPSLALCEELQSLDVAQRCLVEVAAGIARRGRLIARDLVDVCCVAHSGDLSPLHHAVERTGLWPEWALLNEHLERLAPDHTPEPGAAERYKSQVAACRIRRTARARRVAATDDGSPRGALSLGHPLEGAPAAGSRRDAAFRLSGDGAGGVLFSSQFGSGHLRRLRSSH